MAHLSTPNHPRQPIRRHNSYVQFSFLSHSSDTNSYKLTRLNSIFEKAADRKLGGIRADKIARLLPTSSISREKYLTILGHLGIDCGKNSKTKIQLGKKKDDRIISRGPFLAMFAYESVSFLNLFALNEKTDHEKRRRLSLSRKKKESQSKSQSQSKSEKHRRSHSAPSPNMDVHDIQDQSEQRTKHKRKKHKTKPQSRTSQTSNNNSMQSNKKKNSNTSPLQKNNNQRPNQDMSNSKATPKRPKAVMASKSEPLLDIDVNIDNNRKNQRMRTSKAQNNSSKHKRTYHKESLTQKKNDRGRYRDRTGSESYHSSSLSSHESDEVSNKGVEIQHQPISYSYSSSSSESETHLPSDAKSSQVAMQNETRNSKHFDVYDRLLQIDVDFSKLPTKEQEKHMELQRKMYKKYKHKYILQGPCEASKYEQKDIKDNVDKLGECVFFRQVSSFISKLFPPRGSAMVGIAPSPEMGSSVESPLSSSQGHHTRYKNDLLTENPLSQIIHRR